MRVMKMQVSRRRVMRTIATGIGVGLTAAGPLVAAKVPWPAIVLSAAGAALTAIAATSPSTSSSSPPARPEGSAKP